MAAKELDMREDILEEAELKMPGEPGMAGTGGCIPDSPG